MAFWLQSFHIWPFFSLYGNCKELLFILGVLKFHNNVPWFSSFFKWAFSIKRHTSFIIDTFSYISSLIFSSHHFLRFSTCFFILVNVFFIPKKFSCSDGSFLLSFVNAIFSELPQCKVLCHVCCFASVFCFESFPCLIFPGCQFISESRALKLTRCSEGKACRPLGFAMCVAVPLSSVLRVSHVWCFLAVSSHQRAEH